jgi:hypothetical protein
MRILLDENLDWRLGRDLPEHTARRGGKRNTARGERDKRCGWKFDPGY